MASHYMHSSSDAIFPATMLSARSSTTSNNNATLSNAEKVTLYVIAATAGILIILGITIAVLRARCPDGPWAAHHSRRPRERSMAKALLKNILLVQYDDGNDAWPNASKPSLDGATKSLQAEHEKTRSASISEKTTTMSKMENSTCAICVDDFVKNQLVRVLPCGHLFHQGCVDEWLVKRSRTCPSW